MPRRLRSWLRGFPLQRRVFLLTTLAVAVAVAATGLAAYVTLRVSLYNALDDELIEVASTLAVPVAQDITRLGGLTESALRAGDVSVAAYRADGSTFFVPDEREHLVLDRRRAARSPGCSAARSARTGVATDGEQYRIVAVPITQLGNYALVLGRPLRADEQHPALGARWSLVIFGALGVGVAAVVGATVARSSLRPVRQLSAAVEHVTATDDLEPITIAASGDLALLADAFNRCSPRWPPPASGSAS